MQIHVVLLIVCAIPALASPVTELEEELRRFVDKENELISEHRGVSVAARYTGSAVTSGQKKMLLIIHNKARSSVQPPAAKMPPLKWSNELAAIAQNFANKCISKHNTARSSQSRSFSTVGENLYFSIASSGFLREAVNVWMAEKKDYDYSRNYCRGHVCGHYTQIIWADTTHVGCGFKSCATRNPNVDAKYIFCNYGPAGNYDRKPYITATGK